MFRGKKRVSDWGTRLLDAHGLALCERKLIWRMIAFGPISSRRLGRSLGVNNLPAKCCSYSCAYCQIGGTPRKRLERREFFTPEQILREVGAHLEKLREAGEPIDYITFVPNGEATLDKNLGYAIRALAPFGIKIGVITNASLLWREDVRADLAEADWVSVKIDVVGNRGWSKLNRPHPGLKMSTVIEGLLQFAEFFRKDLVTETMLVRSINDKASQMQELSDVLSRVNPRCCYLSIPIRPPAVGWVTAPVTKVLSECHAVLAAKLPQVEYLNSGYEERFTRTGSPDQDILSIAAVHPMEQKAVEEFLREAGADWTVIDKLLENGCMIETEFDGRRFYRKA